MHVTLQQIEQPAPTLQHNYYLGGTMPVACLDLEHDVSLDLDLHTREELAPTSLEAGKIKKALGSKLQWHSDEGWRVRKDGQQFWANVVITALLDKDGCLQGFAKITRDLTERHRAQRAWSDKNTELKNALDAKIRFLANMSHELRTPLNGIIGFAEFLVDGKPGTLNPKQKEYLEDILNSGKHLLELVSDVLDLISHPHLRPRKWGGPRKSVL